MKRRDWLSGCCIALVLHGVLLFALPIQFTAGTYSAPSDGDQGVEIGLGQLGSYRQQIETSVEDSVEPERQVEPEVEPVKSPTPIAEPKPELAVIKPPAPPEEAVKVGESEPVSSQDQTESPEETPVSESVSEVVQSTAESTQHAELKAETDSQAMIQDTGSGQQRQSGGRKGDAQGYFAELMAWLNRHKDYPAELKKNKQQGVVVLTFSINKNGNVTSAKIKKSSGHAQLDNAALAMLAQADPVPSIPNSMGRERLLLTIPVEYSLITE